MEKSDLSKPVLIHVCKDRTMTYTHGNERGKAFNNVALPVFSVENTDVAETLILLVSSLQYNEHPQIPNKPWYKINIERKENGITEFISYLEYEDLDLVVEKLDKIYQLINSKGQIK